MAPLLKLTGIAEMVVVSDKPLTFPGMSALTQVALFFGAQKTSFTPKDLRKCVLVRYSFRPQEVRRKGKIVSSILFCSSVPC